MKKVALVLCTIISLMIIMTQSYADDRDLLQGGRATPEAVIILDYSGSMEKGPDGLATAFFGGRKIDIARAVIKDLLDDDDNGEVNDKDERSLNIRLGYRAFINALNEKDFPMFSVDIADIGEGSYKKIYDLLYPSSSEILGWEPYGATPLVATLDKVKQYFVENVIPGDALAACRDKYVILITDGAETLACDGNGSDTTYQMRMKTVLKARELNDAGISVFTVGFGTDMPLEQQKTLNWAAMYGGTGNPLATKSGLSSAYSLDKNLPEDGNPCSIQSTPECAGDPTKCKPDPANYPLSGYAFLAKDASDLSVAVKTIINTIQERSYGFTSATAPRLRATSGDSFFLSSFIPTKSLPWEGHLQAYDLALDEKGELPRNLGNAWDAGAILRDTLSGDRKIYTTRIGKKELIPFTYDSLSNSDLGYDPVPAYDHARKDLINYVRGMDVFDFNNDGITDEERGWKLGDIFHSNAVVVGSPTSAFKDVGYSGSTGFYETYKDRPKMIIVGANDGMLHAFNGEKEVGKGGGVEEWAYIPPSLLTKLKEMLPVGKKVQYTSYVDSTPKVADVWFDDDGNGQKAAGEWRTVLVCGLREGGNTYFALDITDIKSPKFLWEFPDSTDTITQKKMGETWSEPFIGKVKVEKGNQLVEKWVAFMGGGKPVDKEHKNGDPDGRSFFVVDLETGKSIWSYAFDKDQSTAKYLRGMPSAPTAVDTDLDGYVNKVYIGDLGGQMWVFDVSFDEGSKKSESLWSGRVKRLFVPESEHPIYYQPAVAFDKSGTLWVYFGTGDREVPDKKGDAGGFYAVKDDGKGNYPREELRDLTGVAALNSFTQGNRNGWYIQLAEGEKVLAKPSVFNRLIYFTTYTPDKKSKAETCSSEGSARLYTVEYLSGGGATDFSDAKYLSGETSTRSTVIGDGAPSAVEITVDSEAQASEIIRTSSGQLVSKKIFSPSKSKQLLYWRDVW